MSRPKALLLYLALAIGVLGFDLWSKSAVFELMGATLEPIENPAPNGPVVRFNRGEEHHLISSCFSFEASYNLGAFNGWFSEHPGALLGISILAVLITFTIVVARTHGPILVVSFGLLAGGAVGNLYDRFYYGAVRDFIKVYYGEWVWPNFNIADSAICVGVGLLFLREFLMWRQSKRESDDSPTLEPAAAE